MPTTPSRCVGALPTLVPPRVPADPAAEGAGVWWARPSGHGARPCRQWAGYALCRAVLNDEKG